MAPWACLLGRRLGPLHRVLPRIWLYWTKIKSDPAGKNILLGLQVTLAHDEILTNQFLYLKRGTLQMRIAVSRE